jgi:GTP-binding protein
MGKVHTGRVSVGDPIKALSREGALLGEGKVTKLYCQRGMDKRELTDAGPGDILWLAGVEAGTSACTPNEQSFGAKRN